MSLVIRKSSSERLSVSSSNISCALKGKASETVACSDIVLSKDDVWEYGVLSAMPATALFAIALTSLLLIGSNSLPFVDYS